MGGLDKELFGGRISLNCGVCAMARSLMGTKKSDGDKKSDLEGCSNSLESANELNRFYISKAAKLRDEAMAKARAMRDVRLVSVESSAEASSMDAAYPPPQAALGRTLHSSQAHAQAQEHGGTGQ